MAIELKIESNISAAQAFFSKAEKSLLIKAVKQTLNKSLQFLVTESVREVRKRRALKAKDVKAKWFMTNKNFKGMDARRYNVMLSIRKKPISMIDLVRGSKLPRKQKGIPIAKRKPIRAEITPGESKLLKGAFIAMARGGNYHVFRRKTKDRNPIAKQSLPSLHLYFMLDGFRKPIEDVVGARMQKEFVRVYQYLLEKESAKVKGVNLAG